jgi:hypothetical protein
MESRKKHWTTAIGQAAGHPAAITFGVHLAAYYRIAAHTQRNTNTDTLSFVAATVRKEPKV